MAQDKSLSANEAETRLLATMLRANAIVEELEGISGPDFELRAHSDLFIEIVRRVRAGRPANPATMQQWAEVDAAWSFEALLTIAEEVQPVPRAAVAGLVFTITEAAAKRRLVETLEAAIHAVKTKPTLTALEAMGEAEEGLRGVDIGTSEADTGVSMREAAHAYIARMGGPKTALVTGYGPLDDLVKGVEETDVVYIGGRPGMGKTSFASNLARAWGKRGKRGAYFAMDTSADQLAMRDLAAQGFPDPTTRFAYTKLRQDDHGVPLGYLRALASRLPDCVKVIDCPALTLAGLEARMRRVIKELGGLDFVLIDYLQLMKGPQESPVHRVTALTAGIKDLAKRYRTRMIPLAQLSRGVEGRDEKRPIMSDLRESGSIEQDGDHIWFMYRDAYYLAMKEPKEGNFRSAEGKSFKDAYDEWDLAMRKARNQVEIGVAKNRMGATGIAKLTMYAEFDVTVDRPVHDFGETRQ